MEPTILSPGMLGSDKFVKADTPTLLHAFEDEAEIYREFDSQVFVGLKDIEPSQDWTLVVRGATSNELAVFGNSQSERISVPPVALECLDPKDLASMVRSYFDTTILTGWTSKWP